MLQKVSSDEEVPRCPVSGPGDPFFQQVLVTTQKSLTLRSQTFLCMVGYGLEPESVKAEDMIHENAVAARRVKHLFIVFPAKGFDYSGKFPLSTVVGESDSGLCVHRIVFNATKKPGLHEFISRLMSIFGVSQVKFTFQ